VIQVAIAIDKIYPQRPVDWDFTAALASNFNAPAAVCKAAVLYVFRTLVNDDIP